MLSTRNRFYGLIIGGALADSMGAVSSYAPDLHISNPWSSESVGIKPGYWTEPTGLFIARLKNREALEIEPKSCTGKVAKLAYPILSKLVQASALCLCKDTESCLYTDDVISNETVKLWTSIIDGVLHSMPKRAIFNQDMYRYLNMIPEMYMILRLETNELLSQDLQLLQEVLKVFKNTDNYLDGLLDIVNNSVAPAWTAALYGQLAGAYYGLSDIPEDWMDCLQQPEEFLDLDLSPDQG